MKDFKIINVRTGRVMMHTDDPACVPADETIKSMQSAGYKAYMDGKVYHPGKKQPEKKPAPKKAAKKTNIITDAFGQVMLFM